MAEVNASIITIGDELLIGQTVDTNSAFIAQELNKIGVWVRRRVAIADDKEAILKTLKEEQESSQIVIITGGLGPTADDITKPALCEYFNTELVQDEGATENVRSIFTRLGRPITRRNLSQGMVPGNCTVLQNKRGTAPGMWWPPRPPRGDRPSHSASAPIPDFDQQGKEPNTPPLSVGDSANEVGSSQSRPSQPRPTPPLRGGGGGSGAVASLPGVPHEMKGLMLDSVLPRIKESFHLPAVVHRTLLTAGIGESFLADAIQSLETALPPHIKLAYLPAFGMVRLRLTGRSDDRATVEQEVATRFEQLKELVKEWMVVDEDISLQQAVLNQLKALGKTVATAESCTGGYIAHLITSLPGSSAVFNGSVIAYANAVKQQVLGVKAETLQAVGAVSEETVLQMAAGACKVLGTDYAIATSGIMGPDGGSAEKPVGTVWVAVARKDGAAKAQKFSFRFDRARNIELTGNAALNMLRQFSLDLSPNPSPVERGV